VRKEMTHNQRGRRVQRVENEREEKRREGEIELFINGKQRILRALEPKSMTGHPIARSWKSSALRPNLPTTLALEAAFLIFRLGFQT
jgi:hypothetical protein